MTVHIRTGRVPMETVPLNSSRDESPGPAQNRKPELRRTIRTGMFAASAILLLAAVGAAVLWWSSVPRRTLPGGAKIRLVAVSCDGKTIRDFRSPMDLLREDAAQQGFGPRAHLPSVPFHPTSPGTELIFWTEFGHAYSGTPPRCSLIDEDGRGWPGRLHMQVSGVAQWAIPAFPRRQRNLRFRLEKDSQFVEFPFTNPVAGKVPAWTPDTLPASVSVGKTRFTLVSLQIGAGNGDQPGREKMRAMFRVEQDGPSVARWEPYALEFTDATGNHLGEVPLDRREYLPDGTVAAEGYGSPAALEPVWKVAAHFRQVSVTRPPQSVELTGIRLPQPGTSTPFRKRIRFGTLDLRLESIKEQTEVLHLRPERARGFEIRGWVSDRARVPTVMDPRDDRGGKILWAGATAGPIGADQYDDLAPLSSSFFIRFAAHPAARAVSLRLQEVLPPQASAAKLAEASFFVPVPRR